ncbi:hypothetical protein ABZS88_35235 [Streptomyces sp. NPDC005480]|uniref:hypothetical protein n=1 Tax=Streptomyces sp. NPDC005480 TaxID=3154880 RepID=UPI0033A309CB
MKRISDAESARIAAHEPYASPQVVGQRARPSLPIAERLVQTDALDEVERADAAGPAAPGGRERGAVSVTATGAV